MATTTSATATAPTIVINNCKAHIIDPFGRFQSGVSITGKVEYSEPDSTLNISIGKAPEPSDISELAKGSLLGVRASFNNKSKKYSVTFNYTGDRLAAVGKKTVKAELLDALEAIFDDMEK